MKKLLVSLLVFYCVFFYSQDDKTILKVTYTYNTALPPTGNFDTFLYIADDISQYVHHQKEGSHMTDNGYKLSLPYFQYINNYNLQSKKIEENRILNDNSILYATWDNDIKWIITDEEKVINGIKAKKAITKSFEISEDDDYYYGNAIAWFTTEIPIQSGPARYYGLPGLILELSYENVHNGYTLKSIETIPLSEYSFQKINTTNRVDEKEDLIYFFHKNPKKIQSLIRKK